MEPSSDVSLFLGLATAIATALGAAVALGLLDVAAQGARSHLGWRRTARRVAATATLSAAVLGIVAALVAVGKGESDPLLTVLMFVGVVAPAAFAFWATLHDKLKLSRWPLVGALAAVATAAGALILVTSPDVLRSVVAPHEAERQRARAVAEASKPWYPERAYECAADNACSMPKATTPVFNAFTNSQAEGDERAFLTASIAPRISLLGQNPSQALYVNELEVRPGDEVRLRVYLRNGACIFKAVPPPRPTDAARGVVPRRVCRVQDRLITRNARVGIFIPTGDAAARVVVAVLYADNAIPARIADRVALYSDARFRLEYIGESGRLINEHSGGIRKNSPAPGFGTRLGRKLVSDITLIDGDPAKFRSDMGVRIGYAKLDGGLLPGYGQDGYVLARLRVIED